MVPLVVGGGRAHPRALRSSSHRPRRPASKRGPRPVESSCAGAPFRILLDRTRSGHAPATPKGWKKPKGRVADTAVTTQQERDALDVAREISSKSYVQDFTGRAPDAATLAAELTVARAWSDELKAAESWQAYVRVQRELAWDAALITAKKLKKEADLATEHDPDVATRYPQTIAFLSVWKVAAARAVVTKASKKKAKAAEK